MKPYECWAWLVEDDDGREGVVSQRALGSCGLPHEVDTLHHRDREVAERMGDYARLSPKPVRLAHLVEGP